MLLFYKWLFFSIHSMQLTFQILLFYRLLFFCTTPFEFCYFISGYFWVYIECTTPFIFYYVISGYFIKFYYFISGYFFSEYWTHCTFQILLFYMWLFFYYTLSALHLWNSSIFIGGYFLSTRSKYQQYNFNNTPNIWLFY